MRHAKHKFSPFAFGFLAAGERANKGGAARRVSANNSTDTMPPKSTLVSPRPASDNERFSHANNCSYLLLFTLFSSSFAATPLSFPKEMLSSLN
jgi:hypothetical protein